MTQLIQTLNEHIEDDEWEKDTRRRAKNVNVERLSSESSDEDSSYDEEDDNNTILEAPSVMEQTQYDDAASVFTKKLTRKLSRKQTRKMDGS